MTRTGLALIVVAMMIMPCLATDARLESILRRLDPATRLEQVCDVEVMNKIGRDPNPFHPDRALIGAMSNPTISGDTIRGSGGAFRSAGRWYQFSFACKTSPDHMKVIAFDYRIGSLIPEDKWPDYGLYR